MIRFDNWNLTHDGDILARQFDNLTRTLTVAGDIPSGWDWAMLVQVGEAMDIILLDATEGALSAVLTAQQVSISGYYNMQLRATQGDKVQHTNTVNVYIPASLSGDEQWPTVPSEFSDMERRISEKAAQVEGYATHPPIIGENGNWWEWDGEVYVDTGKPSRGTQGPQGENGEPGAQGLQGLPGEPGEDAYAKAVENGFKGTEAEFYLMLAQLQAALEGKASKAGDTLTGPLYYKSKSNEFLRTDNIVSWALGNLDSWTPLFSAFKIGHSQKISYYGAGAYGEANAKTYTFNFKPKVVIIKHEMTEVPLRANGTEDPYNQNEVLMIAFYGETVSFSSRVHSEKDYTYCTHLSWSGNAITWWGLNQSRHLNVSGWKYNVLAIG